MILSISGAPGSGKTSVAKILASRLNLKFYSMGDFRGKIAQERGMTIDELNALGEQDKSTDSAVDEYQTKLGKTEDNFIAEGRLSWHFIPHSFKIYLACDTHEAARRIFNSKQTETDHGRHDEAMHDSIEETEAGINQRIASDALRYQKYYNLDYRDPAHYDLFLDTTHMKGPEETAEQILTSLESRQP